MIYEIEQYFGGRGVEVEVYEPRCPVCGELESDCTCDDEGAWDTYLEEDDQADIDYESEDAWMDEGAW